MKKALLITSMAFLLISCGGTIALKADSASAENILSAFMNGYKVEAYGTESFIYPSPYEGMSYTSSFSGNREYGSLLREGTKVKAVRDSNGLIHYADEEGVACYDTLDAYNEIATIHEQRWATDILFADLYREPFAYVSSEDIDISTLSLDPEKASFVSATYLGHTHPVKEATFELDEYGRASSLNIVYKTKLDGLETTNDAGETVIYQIEDSFTSRISFSYEVEEFVALAPSSNSNPSLDAAFKKSHDNYTLTLYGNGLSASPKYYVTGEGIYFHPLSSVDGLADGDIYYAYDSFAEVYEPYSYSESTLAWVPGNGTLHKEDILPDFSSLSSAIYEEIGGNYVIIDEAAYSAPISLVVPYLVSGYEDGYGLGGYLSLDEAGNISSINLSFAISIYTYTLGEHFSDYGSTSLPSYLDVEEIGAAQ